MFGDRGGKIVIENLSGDPSQCSESVNVAAHKSFETLAMRELDVQHAAMRIDQRKGVEFTLVAGIIERTEVSPVHFEAVAGKRFHPNEGAVGLELGTNLLHIHL